MKKIDLFRGEQKVTVYEAEVAAYIKDGWSRQKPVTAKEVNNDE